MENKKELLISFSGGRTSAMMTKYLLDNKSNEYNFTVIFANTGHEREATLEFVNRCDKEFGFNTIWIEAVINKEYRKGTTAKIVDFETAYRNIRKNGIDPFEQMISVYGIPNLKAPHCSRELKGSAIRAYMRGIGIKNYYTALGIRTDEPKRLDWVRAKKERLIYFAQMGRVTKSDVNKFWSKENFDLELKSYQGNCILCWKKSDRKLFTLLLESDPELIAEIEWIKEMQIKYGAFIPISRQKKATTLPINFFRKNRNIEEMIEESKFAFEAATDESKLVDTFIQLGLWNEELDMNGGCIESCEAF